MATILQQIILARVILITSFLGLTFVLACDNTCATCFAPNSNNCLSCPAGKYLLNGECAAGISNNFALTNESFLVCDGSCATCSGPGPSSCTSCDPPKTLYSGQCISNSATVNCFLRHYNVSVCDWTCATCSGEAANQCLTCNAPRFLYLNQCIGNTTALVYIIQTGIML